MTGHKLRDHSLSRVICHVLLGDPSQLGSHCVLVGSRKGLTPVCIVTDHCHWDEHSDLSLGQVTGRMIK